MSNQLQATLEIRQATLEIRRHFCAGLTFSKVTTAISRLIIVFLIFVYKWALFRATTSQLIMLSYQYIARSRSSTLWGRGKIANQ